MEVLYGDKTIKLHEKKRLVIASGTFDGVHIGHKTLISHVVEDAKEMGGRSAVLIFNPHPQQVISGEKQYLLTTLEDRVELISRLGVDLLILMSFTEELSSLSAEEFVLDVLLRGVGAKKMWVGKNHLFGVGRRGDAELLRQMGEEHGFEVGILDGVVVNGVKVSSTKVREWLSQGKVREVIPLLGHLPFLSGKVTSGEGIGREVGYPTCNLSLPSEILIPASGVYAVHVRINDERFFGVANVGCKPTFKGEKKGVEVHLFDFQREIYGSKIRVFFVQKIRDEKCFKDKEALRVQLKKDESIARAILRREEDECQNSNQWFWKNWKSSS